MLERQEINQIKLILELTNMKLNQISLFREIVLWPLEQNLIHNHCTLDMFSINISDL